MGPGFESPKADHVYKAQVLLYNVRGPLVKWLRQRPLTPLTSVQIRYGSPVDRGSGVWYSRHTNERDSILEKLNKVGADCGEGPPVPIPNTEVKLTCAYDTWLATARENW